MAVYIFDADVLFRMAAVEGERWLVQQDRNRTSPYGFHAWLDGWNKKVELADPSLAGEPLSSFVEGGDGSIYGEGGYARYAVAPDGEVVLRGWSSSNEAHRERARLQGISIR